MSLISWRIIKHGLSPLIRVAQDVEATTNLDAGRRIETAPGLPELDGIVLGPQCPRRTPARATSCDGFGSDLRVRSWSVLAYRELHDDVGQTLHYALLLLQSAQDDPHSQQKIAMAQDAVRTSLQTVRQLAAHLRPSVLADIGLVSALTSWPQLTPRPPVWPCAARSTPSPTWAGLLRSWWFTGLLRKL
ncbi:hypothetical protein FAM22021_002194 [Propionibacterium freudenreichii]|nr:hypothetical protein [Propionibacterium freudenreichii]